MQLEPLTTPNIILGSLATVGVLGMADVLIYKGKHLSKITGKTKELEEVTSSTTVLEKVNKQLKDLTARLKQVAGMEGETEIVGEGEFVNLVTNGKDYKRLFAHGKNAFIIPLDLSSSGGMALRELRKIYTDYVVLLPESPQKTELLERVRKSFDYLGYELVEKYDENLVDCFEFSQGAPSLKDIKVTIPAILDKNGDLVESGLAVFPTAAD